MTDFDKLQFILKAADNLVARCEYDDTWLDLTTLSVRNHYGIKFRKLTFLFHCCTTYNEFVDAYPCFKDDLDIYSDAIRVAVGIYLYDNLIYSKENCRAFRSTHTNSPIWIRCQGYVKDLAVPVNIPNETEEKRIIIV